ncbi:4Fe-4S dicluster domain-containing protein [Dissulfurirhabdus thermomarina]|uniref:4Fe-4S dicluster domain-containing protein n=1 Tax=Dissulfurirhabdus thermomarina TaxID=1765737 RepID=A0A6N9TQ17_DISTH|nr:4Fe-4S dicluster domain-containing protein [Dissulfurirhabdus thermomarina]NDY43138.1 4Fe-4S dicluster domain-containing protein [Dissulfurirhabdus thermomarina]NMX23994.1 4Fe-4S dicluster domain-containing protein [Dissulfurirhabdus thermomarina]
MGLNRREFLKIAGVSTMLGLGGMGSIELLAPGSLEASGEFPAKGAASGIRYGMVVDMRRCAKEEGCKKCITACHTTHNVPDHGNRKDEVKWIWKEPFEAAFPGQHHEYPDVSKEHPFIVLCNHCEHPPCVRVCPTKATFKRPDGIVMMDMHRCIGCRFCMAACPFGARSFNWKDPRLGLDMNKVNPAYPTRTRGVVEKCTFCTERLAQNKLPACVEACPEKALVFGNLHDPNSEIRRALRENHTIRRKPELGTRPSVFYIV